MIALLNGISISDFDKKRKLIVLSEESSGSNRHFLANEMTADLIESLQTAATMEEARQVFCGKRGFTLSDDEFRQVVVGKLGPYGLLESDSSRTSNKRSGYLKLKVQVLSERSAGNIAKWFSFLFGYTVFSSLLAVIAIANVVNFALLGNAQLKTGGLVVSLLLFGLSTAFHEIGHVAACRSFGGKHGGMGFGFYIIFPVAYSELTGIWALGKGERIVVNLAGIYMQLLYAAVLVGGGLSTGLQELNLAAGAITLSAILQLNPFLRMDGYWLLCDLTGQPNLMPKASKAVKGLFVQLYHSIVGHSIARSGQAEERSVWVLLYGIANMSVGLMFMALIYAGYTKSIMNFPEKTLTIMQSILRGSLDFQELTVAYLTTFTFYVLLLLQMKSALSAIIKTKKTLFLSKPERKIGASRKPA